MSLVYHPNSRTRSQDHPYSGTVRCVYESVKMSPIFFKDKLNGKTLIDIGSPEPLVAYTFLGHKGVYQTKPLFQELNFYRALGGKTIFDSPLDLGLERFVMVDPFHVRRGTVPLVEHEKAVQPELEGKVVLASQDGLEFLKSQPNESACVMTTSIDCFVIDQGLDYFKSLAEEIYRIVPEGGIYISIFSDSEEYARKLFPNHYPADILGSFFGGVQVFEKAR